MKYAIFLLFTCLLLSGCLTKQPEWKKKNVKVDLTGLNDIERSIETTEVEDLDNNKKYSYDDIEREEIVVEDYEAASVFDDAEMIAEVQGATFNEPIIISGAIRAPASFHSQYKVVKADTYMKIAWKLYGDLPKWRKVAKLNQFKKLVPGDVIDVPYFDSPFVWNPGGEPYLILKDENLSRISVKWYGAGNGYRWKSIWKHNERLIKDPHMIFAGFTIYTLPELERQIASEDQ